MLKVQNNGLNGKERVRAAHALNVGFKVCAAVCVAQPRTRLVAIQATDCYN
ncbi:TPA: hypothetical protein ACQWGN_001809 [Neisseria subflava]